MPHALWTLTILSSRTSTHQPHRFFNIFAHESKRVATMELVVNSKGYVTLMREQVAEMKETLVHRINAAATTVIKAHQVTYPTLCILLPTESEEVAWCFSFSPPFKFLYLVMHWSDFSNTKSAAVLHVLVLVLILYNISYLVPRVIGCYRYRMHALERPRTNPHQVGPEGQSPPGHF